MKILFSHDQFNLSFKISFQWTHFSYLFILLVEKSWIHLVAVNTLYKIYNWCKFCIFYHTVNSKFTARQSIDPETNIKTQNFFFKESGIGSSTLMSASTMRTFVENIDDQITGYLERDNNAQLSHLKRLSKTRTFSQ